MKTRPLVFLFVFFASLVSAQDARAPQPRVKLDPVARVPVANTATEPPAAPAEPAVMMDRFVVKGIAAMPFVQRKEPVLQGKFTPLRGGSLLERDFGKKRVFIGLKPWFDIMEDDLRFKHPTASRINVTLFQLGF